MTADLPKRTLVVGPSWVGDAVISQPLLALLRERAPDTAIDVLVPAWCGPVYARMREVASVVDSPFGHGELRLGDRRRLARRLRERGYSRAYVLPNSLKSALVPWLARIPERVGFVGERRGWLLTDSRRLDANAMPRLVERFASLAFPGGEIAAAIPAPHLIPDREARVDAAARLGLDTSRPVLALCPGAEYGPAKRWPPAHFVAVARDFAARGYAVWVFGSPNDAEPAAAIEAAVRGAVNLVGRTGLAQAIDLLSFATRVVTNDSGLMHVAAALGRPLVAIFGSSSPDYTPPLSPTAAIARLGIECSPCFARVCPLGHTRCLVDLAPDTVLALARELPDG
jgi:heptosyltransferase-2